MRVSVVICSHTTERYDDLREAVQSVFEQSYEDVEVVLVSDGDPTLCDQLKADYGSRREVQIHCNHENRGLSASRNTGVELATGDVVAFMDDDAVADSDWIANLVEVYERHEALAVGGRMAARWAEHEPAWLPVEFYWLVGVTYRGFRETEGEVRNTFGSNISFRREAFVNLGGFDEALGLKGDGMIQGEEMEFCDRFRNEYGEGVIYTPDAVVEHKVDERRLQRRWLLRRAYWQGVTKGLVHSNRAGRTVREEQSYIRSTVVPGFFRTMKAAFTNPSTSTFDRMAMFIAFTAATGVGFVWATTSRRIAGDEGP